MSKRRMALTVAPLLMIGCAASAQVRSNLIDTPSVAADDTVTFGDRDAAPSARPAVLTMDAVDRTTAVDLPDTVAPDPAELECVAKVVVHEAGNQPRRGQLAVAQVIRTRMKSGGFGESACDVVRQRGQFFDIDRYHPSRTDARWAIAMAVATEALSDRGEAVAPGALFFHSAGASMPTRIRVAKVADHTFYR